MPQTNRPRPPSHATRRPRPFLDVRPASIRPARVPTHPILHRVGPVARNQFMQAVRAMDAYRQVRYETTNRPEGPLATWLRVESQQIPELQQELRMRFDENATPPAPNPQESTAASTIASEILINMRQHLIGVTPETAHNVSATLQHQLTKMDENLVRLREVQSDAGNWNRAFRAHHIRYQEVLYQLRLTPNDGVATNVNQSGTTDQAPRNSGAWRESADKYPPSMVCSIVLEPFRDPVQAEDGHSYERVAIERWLVSGTHTSPKTGAPMGPLLRVNHGLRSVVEEFTAMLAENDEKTIVM